MKYGNCWTYAIPRFVREGGFIIVRWSPRNKFIPHISYSRDLETIEEFVPDRPRTGLLGILSSFVFRGSIKKGALK